MPAAPHTPHSLTVLDCLRVPNGDGLDPIPGDIVIVERINGDMRETTCKRLEQLPNGDYQLVADSTRPEFAEPIPLGSTSEDHHIDTETRVIGIVYNAINRVFRR